MLLDEYGGKVPDTMEALLKLPGVDDMNAALTYKNKDLFLRRADIVLPEGEYFDDELLGLEVYDCDTGALLGTLTAVDEYGMRLCRRPSCNWRKNPGLFALKTAWACWWRRRLKALRFGRDVCRTPSWFTKSCVQHLMPA